MRHSTTKTTGKFGKSVAVMLALLITVSMAAVAFTAAQAPVVSAAQKDDIVEVGKLADSDKAYWVDATYFDYLSDVERASSGAKWLEPIQAGTGYNGSADNWYPFNDFNSYISSNTASGTYPLYFGNFCFTPGSYGGEPGKPENRGGPYISRVRNLRNFSYIANNSNAIKRWRNGSYDNTIAVQGLAQDKLDSNGNIMATGGGVMPYFNESALTSGNYAKVIHSYFPFRESITAGGTTDEVRTYSFSSDGTDNVFFNWSSPKNPETVNYGQGSKYAVEDGLKNFMYNTKSGIGLFPFNNKDTATAGNRGGNSNLDYGFGIKMEFDFKVPEGGTYPNGKAAEFSYYGDDDLWVYMAEYQDESTLGDSKLVLDIGGNHSKSRGSINFNTMKSTAEEVVDISKAKKNLDPNYIYIHDDYGWGFIDDSHTVKKKNVNHNDANIHKSNVQNIQINAWGNGKQTQFYVPLWDEELQLFKIRKDAKGSGREFATGDQYGEPLQNMSNFLVTEITDGAMVDADRMSNHFSVSNSIGKVIYTSDTSYTKSITNYEVPSYAIDSNDLTSSEYSFSTVNGKLDSSKKYHMTIFYMERGMIESNNHMSFMLTPADNELKVEKEVKVDNVNPALQSDVKSKDKFDFKVQDTATNGKSRTAKLGDGENVYYNSDFKTGSTLTVTETSSSNLSYSTDYEVRDMMNETPNGKVLISKPGMTTDTFQLLNSEVENDYDDAHIHVKYVNTPNVAPLTISKEILEEKSAGTYEKSDTMKDTFEYTMAVDLEGGTNYKAYNLDYTVSGETGTKKMTNGVFSFSSDKTVTVAGLPIGATYQITESDKSGYEAVKDTITGKVGTDGTAFFQNKKLTTKTNAAISAKKTLDGQNYSGDLFSFTLQGLGSIGGSKDVSSQSQTVTRVNGGKITFNNIEYTEAGTYRYKIVENAVIDSRFANDITTDSKIYLVNVVVTPKNGALSATVTYKATAKQSGYTAADFEGGSETAPTFANNIKKGSATVEKYNQSNKKLADTTFTIYKVESGSDSDLSNNKKIESLTTGADGKVKFDNLDIYEAGYTPAANAVAKYQWYCIVESDSATGYSKNETKVYFQLPQKDVYDITFTYQNGKIFSPTASGEGMEIFKTIGIAVSVLALLLLAAYIYNSRRYRRRYAK